MAMRIPVGGECAIAVESSWRHSQAINAFIGRPDNPKVRSEDSSMITAKILEIDDPIGLWIELNSERRRYPNLPTSQLVIPWRFVLGVWVPPEDSVDRVSLKSITKRYGFEVTDDVEVTTATTAAGPEEPA